MGRQEGTGGFLEGGIPDRSKSDGSEGRRISGTRKKWTVWELQIRQVNGVMQHLSGVGSKEEIVSQEQCLCGGEGRDQVTSG